MVAVRAVMVLEVQGEVSWKVPPGAPDGVLLFETSSAHMHDDFLTFLGGPQGWSLTFKVCAAEILVSELYTNEVCR